MSDSHNGSLKAVIYALVGNSLIATIKYVVSFFTLSSAMLAEAVHSTADCLNQVFLLIGNKRAKKHPTEMHSFGYERESFFWGLMVAVLLFFIGALFSIQEGIHKLNNPEPLKNMHWIFIVLIASIFIEGKSFSVAYIEFKKRNKKSFIKGIEESTDTNLLVILLEDFAALSGLVIVLLTTLLSFINPIFDAIGSVLVGILLASVSVKLANEIRKLIIGESMSREKRAIIKEIVSGFNNVKHVNSIKTMALGTNKYLILISVDIEEDATGYDIEDMVEQIKLDIKAKVPEAYMMSIEPRDSNRNNKI